MHLALAQSCTFFTLRVRLVIPPRKTCRHEAALVASNIFHLHLEQERHRLILRALHHHLDIAELGCDFVGGLYMEAIVVQDVIELRTKVPCAMPAQSKSSSQAVLRWDR